MGQRRFELPSLLCSVNQLTKGRGRRGGGGGGVGIFGFADLAKL